MGSEKTTSQTAFVTGWPVEHSRSPLIHKHWLAEHNITGDYTKVSKSPQTISNFLCNLNEEGFVGGNVTIPHKEVAYDVSDHLSPNAKMLGAVNTVWLQDEELFGDNTDGYGFLANLDEWSAGWDSDSNRQAGALVLGGGGASRAIIASLLDRGFQKVWIANRTKSKAENLVETFGKNTVALGSNETDEAKNAAIIINTTSVGMGDNASPIDLKQFPNTKIVNDIVYVPLKTPLLKQAEKLGIVAVDGLGMLLHQAVPGFEKWFGIRPKVTQELRDILLRDLGELE